MKVQIIKNELQYDLALSRVDSLLNLKVNKNTDLGNELELLLLVIQEYEDKNHAINLPDPIEVIKLKMLENGLKNIDLEKYIGNKSYVSQILNKKKPLTVEMMKKFNKNMGISAQILLN